jgi:lambda family phage portal protein
MTKLFGKFKRIFTSTSEPTFAATTKGRMRSWIAPNTGTNTAIVYSLSELRAKSRDLTRHFTYMNGAYETIASNIVGPGINVMPKHDDCNICDRLKELWADWQDECDIEGVNSFSSLLSLAVRERWEAGEVFIRFIPTVGGTIPLKLMIIPAEQCKLDENHLNNDGSETIAGITTDKCGNRLSYTFYKNNPNESLISLDTYSTIEIPAEEICHYYKQLWAGQRRGIPEAFASLLKSREMLEYDEAELAKKKIAAMLAAFVTSPNPEGVLNNDADDEYADEGEAVSNITTGTITTLAPGEDIKFNPPVESGSSYEPFMTQNLRAIAQSLQLTYEEFANDMSKTNFSSSRMGLNITQRKHRQEQQRFIHQVVKKVWKKFVETAVISGALEVDLNEYNRNPNHFFKARYQAPGWAYVNPQQEVAAQKEKVLCGFASRSQIIAENGNDAAEVDAQIAADAERAENLGLVFATDPTNGQGAPKTFTDKKIHKN